MPNTRSQFSHKRNNSPEGSATSPRASSPGDRTGRRHGTSPRDPVVHWTVARLAERWQVSQRTVRRLIRRGKLPALRIEGQLRVSPEALAHYEEQQMLRAEMRSR
jgi:excisionase family DNA binding protein